MMKIGIELKKTSELTVEEIQKINRLKQQYWKYKEQEHIKWFKENIKPDDLHLLIQRDIFLIAYLNIVQVDVNVNQNIYKMLGVGNVCVEKEHSGMGAIMMASANAFVKEMNSCGILLCRNKLVQFYEKSNWKKYDVMEVVVMNHTVTHNVMVYDPHKYLPEYAKKILCSRNF